MDPRLISAAALAVIGLVLIWFVIRVWLTHPINRVFVLGPFVTENGLRVLLNNCPTILAVGLFALTAAAAKLAYALRWANHGNESVADFFGAAEAAFAIWAAGCVLIAAVRLCRKG
jgi:hypothetical protein